MIRTLTSSKGWVKARSTWAPAGRYCLPSAISLRRKSPMWAMRSATGSSARAHPASTTSCRGRPAMADELSQVWCATRTEGGEMITKGGRPRPRGMRAPTRDSLDRAGHHALDEVALERAEQDQRDDQRQEGDGREEGHGGPELPHLGLEVLGHRRVRRVGEDQGDEHVVAHPEELEDAQRRDGGLAQREDHRHEDPPLRRAVHPRRLQQGGGDADEEVPEQEDREG